MISDTLHEHEKKVLIALKTGELSQEELSKKTGLQGDSIAHACLWLESKGLVKTTEERKELFKLGSEGKSYLKEGLPERQVLSEFKKGRKTIGELEKALGKEKTKIGVSWLARQKLAKIKSGKIELTADGLKMLKGETKHERVLNMFKEHDSIQHIQGIEELLKRGKLIKKVDTVKRRVALTEKGKALVGKGIKIEDTVNLLTSRMIKSGDWKKVKLRPYDVTAPVPATKLGKRQPYLALLEEARQYLIAMGFIELRTPLIETEFWNFDTLYQPQFHPARTRRDTYYIKKPNKGEIPEAYTKIIKETHENGWKTGSTGWKYHWDPEKAKNLILRTHTTVSSVRAMNGNKKTPAKYFTISRNFRRDVIDATHLPEFFQCEGIIIQENMNFRELLGVLKEFAKKFAGTEKISFRPSYFPYTEPSVELVAEHPKLGPIELGGAGMFRPEVRLPAGVESEVMAWGLGFDRLCMIKLGIKDIRDLFSKDLNWLEKTPVVID